MAEDTAAAVVLPTELGRLSDAIDAKPESFASGDDEIRQAALQAAKFIFEHTIKSEKSAQAHISQFLSELTDLNERPQTRAQARAAANGETMSQEQRISDAILRETPLTELHVEGMEDDQIWAQLELKSRNVCETLEKVFDSSNMDSMKDGDMTGMELEDEDDEEDEDEIDDDALAQLEKMGGMNGGWDMEEDSDDDDEEEDELEEEEMDEDDEGDGDGDDLGEQVMNLRDAESDDDEESAEESTSSPIKSALRKPPRKKHPELDDDFFNLAEFNAQTEEAESRSVSRGALGQDSDEDEEADDDGPVNFFAPVDNGTAFDEEDMEESGETYYKDFFAPPERDSKKKAKTTSGTSKPKSSKVRFHDEVRVKNIKSQGRGVPLSMGMGMRGNGDNDDDDEGFGAGMEIDEDDDDDIEEGLSDEDGGDSSEDERELDEGGIEDFDDGREAVERLKDDLFAEEEAPGTGLSTHGSRMEELKKQISALEEENVADKEWVLKGEVGSRGRPRNALLEEDLDFERVTKPVPVVTEDVVQDLEARIKARIVEGRFDDVVRKRAVDDKPFLPSRMFELQDSKSKESLSQIYEKEYVATQGGTPLDDRDGKLKKEHDEIEKMWEGISYKLDALCNAHFTPKQPKAIISTVNNAAAVSLESALPTAQSTSTIMAPEETFDAQAKELQARSEMTPTQKRAARGREKKHQKKQREMLDKSVDKFAKMNGAKGMKGVKKQKEAALKSIVKSGKGVTVIGKRDPALEKKKRTKA